MSQRQANFDSALSERPARRTKRCVRPTCPPGCRLGKPPKCPPATLNFWTLAVHLRERFIASDHSEPSFTARVRKRRLVAQNKFRKTKVGRAVMKIMIVDDHAEMRRLLRSMCSDLTSEVTECADGAQAIAAFAQDRPDWTIMDIAMKGVNGLE